MPEFAIFEMSDGTTTINFLQGTNVGFHLKNWTPAIAQAKGGGTFQSSSLSTGRRLADRKFDNIIDGFDLNINGANQNQVIFEIQETFRLLEKATQYWTTDWQSDPVWIKAQAKCEDNPRYALIVDYKWEELDNPYAQPFYTPFQLSVMDNITLALEHKHWLCNQPGTSICQELTSQRDWNFDEEWTAKTVAGSATIPSFFLLAANGYLFAGGADDILRSIDNGENWALSTALPSGGDNLKAMIQLANGDILASDPNNGNVYRTQNNGGAWALAGAVSDPPGGIGITSFVQLANGDILASYPGGVSTNLMVDKSVDGGVTWNNISEISSNNGSFTKMILLSNGNIIACFANSNIPSLSWAAVFVSADSGVTWETLYELRVSGGTTDLLLLSDGTILFNTSGTSATPALLYKSTDNGATFQFLYDFDDWKDPGAISIAVNSMYEDTIQETLYIVILGATDRILISDDQGESWRKDHNFSGAAIAFVPIIKASDNTVLAASTNSQVIGKDITTIQVGADETCTNALFLSNKENISNLTHIKIDDGGVFTDIMPISVFPQNLLPAISTTNDAIYFGIDPNIVMTDGLFSNLIFDIDTPTSIGYGASNLLEWEYYNGAWKTLSVSDRTHALSVPGPNSVSWIIPSDWIAVAIDGITAYWVRLRNNTFTPIITPTQQNRQIYTNTWSNIQIEAVDILGDIPALFRAKIFNTSDVDGRDGDAPDLWSNRLIVGLRSTLRGSKFQAFLNASDEMLDERAIVILGTNVSFSTDITVPTGRKAVYNPAGAEAMADRVRFVFPQNIIDDFYGTFHVFLRVQRTTGSSTDFDIQLNIINGTGGIEFTTKSNQVQGTAAWELLDFGRITMPVGGRRIIGDNSEIAVQASSASGTPNLEIYDLVLIPVDEWSGDFIDFANSNNSVIGVTPDLAHSKYLDIDSLSDFKLSISSIARRGDGSDFMSSHYNAISPGEAILQANAQQRIWVLSARTSAIGASFQWLSEPWVLHSIQMFKNERYLGLRGER